MSIKLDLLRKMSVTPLLKNYGDVFVKSTFPWGFMI